MSDLFTQQSTMPELFKTGEDIAEELKAQTVEPNTATDLLLNGDSKPNRFSRQCAENEEPDADLTENLLHDEKSNKNTITGTNTPRAPAVPAPIMICCAASTRTVTIKLLHTGLWIQ